MSVQEKKSLQLQEKFDEIAESVNRDLRERIAETRQFFQENVLFIYLLSPKTHFSII